MRAAVDPPDVRTRRLGGSLKGGGEEFVTTYKKLRRRIGVLLGWAYVVITFGINQISINNHVKLIVSANVRISNGSSSISKRAPKLGDGCYHIFLDVGANIGVHTRFLFEPKLYPRAEKAHAIFDKEFGKERSNLDFCSFGFEPNPIHVERHRQLEAAYKSMGWRYHFVHAAASDDSGNMTFYHSGADEKQHEWGFTENTRYFDRESNKDNAGRRAEHVPMIRLATWIRDNILDRELPAVYGNYESGPKVVMKFDIESSEFKVLPDLWFTGIMCEAVDFAFGETHGWLIDYEGHAETGHGGLHLKERESQPVIRDAFKLFNGFKHCKTTIREMDDESYLHDDMPVPNIERSILE